MKVLLLAGANSIHTIKWANGLQNSGLQVFLVSQHPLMHELDSRVKYYELPFKGNLGYFTMVSKVKKIINEIEPDIVNAHYASGYGTTARLVGFHPYVLSVWGSDIFLFPKKSFIHKWLVKKNLLSADTVASTSQCMANETSKLLELNRAIEITPFGVDESVFGNNRIYKKSGFISEDRIVIGTVKSLKPVYGIDILIEAFALLHSKLSKNNPELTKKLCLRIVGGGDELDNLTKLAKSLNIHESIEFVGQVEHSRVPQELEKLDIYVALSRSESFGVAILEAGLNQCPVIVSNVGGLPELVIDHHTGIIVESENITQAADAMYELITQPQLIAEYGKNAQKHVVENYIWKSCITKMINVLESTVSKFKKGEL
ncbi:glycosyltransferase [Acinetobacter chinensis]|jgi:glycosyltransferase involved in cell wall biosynthesis|uniref:glycosyltransferase n=1 Tax=Acinetobacter chinensis TaxID=2004650 RepID=UPI0029349AD3|nr:glycosyltransferase [Acinetobacter chinensis]WOE41674.1 glycosyltransferase [Acinetobacter chinensis]